jgi:hypothetical protein
MSEQKRGPWFELIAMVKRNIHCYESISLANDDVERLLSVVDDLLPDPFTVDATHTDPGEKETALALANKKLARAEEALKEATDAIEAAIRIKDLWTYNHDDYLSNGTEGQALSTMLQKFNDVLGITEDTQLRDTIGRNPVSFLQPCKFQSKGSPVKCRDPYNFRFAGPCSKNCAKPTKEKVK